MGYILKNYDDLVVELTGILIEHDKDHYTYQRDVYLYDRDGVGELYVFENVGGNSWLNDDHYTLVCLKQQYTDWTDTFQVISEIANVLEWSKDSLISRVYAWKCETVPGFADDWTESEIGYQEVREFINGHEPLLDQIQKAEREVFDEFRSDYNQRAIDLLDEYIEYKNAEQGIRDRSEVE